MGVVLWYAMPYGQGFYSGSAAERIGAVLAIVAVGGVAFVLAALALPVLTRDTVTRLMRRQG